MKRNASRLPSFSRYSTIAGLIALSACADAPEDGDAAVGPGPGPIGSFDSGVITPGTGNNPSGDGGSSPGNNSGNSNTSDGGSNTGNSGSNMDAGTSGRNDAGSASGGSGCLLKPNKDGWIDVASNGAHVQGAVFTYASAGSTITPLTSATMPFTTAGDGKLCVKGEGAKVLDMDYAMYFGAGLAFDLCQASSSAPTKYTLSQCPLGSGLGGIRFQLTGASIPSELRVQFHEANREQSSYVLAKAGANEALFKDGKVIYDTTAPPVNVGNIDSVHFAIPTNALATTPFDFCVEQIEFIMTSGSCEGGGSTADGGSNNNDAGATTGDAGRNDAGAGDSGTGSADSGTNNSASCSKSGAWSTTERYGSRNYGKYVVRNNFWNQGTAGAGSQTLWANSERCWGVDANHQDAAPKGTVKSYADVQRGWGIGTAGFPNSQHGLAIQVSALSKAKIRWRMQAPTEGRTWALWDIYFHESANPGNGVAPVNLMIQQRIVDSDRWMQQSSASWPKVTIGGVTFREKRETGSTVSSTRNRIQLYVDSENGNVLGVDDLRLDLKAVIDYYVQQNVIRSSDYLTSIQAGFEIVSGGTYQTSEFWTAVQSEPDGP